MNNYMNLLVQLGLFNYHLLYYSFTNLSCVLLSFLHYFLFKTLQTFVCIVIVLFYLLFLKFV